MTATLVLEGTAIWYLIGLAERMKFTLDQLVRAVFQDYDGTSEAFFAVGTCNQSWLNSR
jgi:hypothetical protein